MKWIISILILSLLVIVHEYGHFLLAKLNGVEVREFSVGFGPRLLSTSVRGTRYSLKLLPFGGSCRMKSMLEDYDGDEAMQVVPEEGTFEAATAGQRAAILFAGPLFNFLLALVGAVVIIGTVGYDPAEVLAVQEGSPAAEAGLMEGDVITRFMGDSVEIGRDIAVWTALHELPSDGDLTVSYRRDGREYTASFAPEVIVRYLLGITYSQNADQVVIQSVSEGSPIALAGVREHDIITAVNGTEITTPESLQTYFREHPMDGSEVSVAYTRNGEETVVSLVPYKSETPSLGFSYNLGRVKTTPIGVLKYAAIEIRYQISTVIRSLGGLFTGRFTVNDMSGPVGIVDMVGDTYEESRSEGALIIWMNMINMIVLLSANLGVMNLLPIPGVDGGKLVGVLFEIIRGKRVSPKLEGTVTAVTAVLLLALMLYIMYHDIMMMLP